MIRKIVIVSLVLGTIVFAVFSVRSYKCSVCLIRLSRASAGINEGVAYVHIVLPDWPLHGGQVRLLGFTWYERNVFLLQGGGGHQFKRYMVPWWLICGLLGMYPAVAFVRGPVRRWHRQRRGLCLKCAYNLTGNVSGVCPECGTEINKP